MLERLKRRKIQDHSWIATHGTLIFDGFLTLTQDVELSRALVKRLALEWARLPDSEKLKTHELAQLLRFAYSIYEEHAASRTQALSSLGLEERFVVAFIARAPKGLTIENSLSIALSIPVESVELMKRQAVTRLTSDDQVALTSKSVPLPEDLKSDPLHAETQHAGVGPRGTRLWRKIPWPIRTALEGTSIVLVVLMGVSAGPKIREFYERELNQSLRDLTQTFFQGKRTDAELSDVRLGRASSESRDAHEESGQDFMDEAASDDSLYSESEIDLPVVDPKSAVKVGSREIWRFNLKTDSPRELRMKVVQVLQHLKIDPETPGLGGIEAPGGIQFDLIVPQSAVPGIKAELERIAPSAPEGTTDAALSNSFTWYKNLSRRPIPAGKTRVVIWLSQI